MTKHIILGFIATLLVGTAIQAQQLKDDFESGTLQWVGDDCEVDAPFTNPFSNASNSSNNVLKYGDVGGTYANIRLDVSSKFDLSDNHTFSLKIYVPSSSLTGSQTNQVSLKLQNSDLGEPWTTQTEVIKSIALDQWQTLTFNFKDDNFINLDAGSPDPIDRTDLDRVLIQVNGENNNDQVTAYIDDFEYDGEVTVPGPAPTYGTLIWSDEFDGGPVLDTSKWYHQTLLPNGNSWYNNEIQHYTDRQENSFVEDGNLHIRALKGSFTDQGVTKEYTSARLNSKFAFTYGKVEVRAKLPRGAGTWPAIWTLGKNIDEPGGYWQPTYGTVPWPACGEIDIMEHWGHNQNYVSSALHTPSSFGGTVNVGGTMNPTASDSFHIYRMIWSEDRIQFFLDDYNYYTYEPETQNMDTWPFIEDQYILLNIAIEPSIDPQFTQSDMVIDYVRVYREDDPQGLKEKENGMGFKVFPNPTEKTFSIQSSELEGMTSLFLYNAAGVCVMNSPITASSTSFDVSALPRGVFTVMLQREDQRSFQRLILH